MPSAPQTRRKIIEDILSLKGKNEPLAIYDLGSGWGGFCRKLARAFPKAEVKGFEISPIPYWVSRLRRITSFRRSYSITKQNIFTTDVSQADIIICYLSPYHMERFKDEILPRMKKGSLLYSQGFPLKNHEADAEIKTPFSLEGKIYRYIV